MACTFVVEAVLAVPVGARADGLYDRFDGDLVLSVGAGAELQNTEHLAPVLDLRARYLDTAGLVLAGSHRDGPATRIFAGVELRPLFPILFFLNRSVGEQWMDLLFQSLHFELGATVQAGGTMEGAVLSMGGGLSIPVIFEGTEGLFLRFGVRHLASRASDQGAPGALSEWNPSVFLTFRGLASTGLTSKEP